MFPQVHVLLIPNFFFIYAFGFPLVGPSFCVPYFSIIEFIDNILNLAIGHYATCKLLNPLILLFITLLYKSYGISRVSKRADLIDAAINNAFHFTLWLLYYFLGVMISAKKKVSSQTMPIVTVLDNCVY